MFSTELQKTAEDLGKLIHPSGPSFRPHWYRTIGLSHDKNEVEYLIVYATNVRGANKFLRKVLDSEGKFGNFKVIVRKTGPIALALK